MGCDSGSRRRSGIESRVLATPFIDTHEHLPDEVDRLAGRGFPCDDWSLLLHDYLASDLLSAGMPAQERTRLFSREVGSIEKWQILEPFWPKVLHTGFGQAMRISMQKLYGIEALEGGRIEALQQAYEELRRPGFYRKILVEVANIESCLVNSHGPPFHESKQPLLLMQDLSFQDLHIDPDVEALSSISGIEVRSLEDWHGVIHWWFDKYSRYATSAKSQGAYLRGLNYRRVGAEEAAPLFERTLLGEELGAEERRVIEDHLFWVCVDQATRNRLPVKIHTGYLAGDRLSQFRRIVDQSRDIIELCRKAPETTFVFLHIGFPNWQELIAVAKRFPNAHIDMSWAWILDPTGAKDFLKRYLVTAPANKVYTFGGDYSVVECVVGHAVMARRGITQALDELVDEAWLGQQEAMNLIEPLMNGNARETFRLGEKATLLAQAPWL
jgi:predicted TIM-barrel fold metal-dependent hydrolase